MNATWKQKLTAELKRDKKKTVVLATLSLVALIFVGRLLAKRAAPSMAQAAGNRAQVRRTTGEPTQSSVSDRTVGSTPKAPRGPVERSFVRDIFVPNMDFYPPVQAAPGANAATVEQTIDPDEILKAKENAIRAQAGALDLQSVMVAPSRSVMIDGRVLRIGEWISDFRVMAITSRSCQLQKNGVKVVLEIKD